MNEEKSESSASLDRIVRGNDPIVPTEWVPSPDVEPTRKGIAIISAEDQDAVKIMNEYGSPVAFIRMYNVTKSKETETGVTTGVTQVVGVMSSKDAVYLVEKYGNQVLSSPHTNAEIQQLSEELMVR
jgi:hypothetical protein